MRGGGGGGGGIQWPVYSGCVGISCLSYMAKSKPRYVILMICKRLIKRNFNFIHTVSTVLVISEVKKFCSQTAAACRPRLYQCSACMQHKLQVHACNTSCKCMHATQAASACMQHKLQVHACNTSCKCMHATQAASACMQHKLQVHGVHAVIQRIASWLSLANAK